MKFEAYDIAPEIKKSLSELGFKKPTDIQFRSIPPILKGEDVLAIAQTGTGKTAAFAIPVLHKIHRHKKNAPANTPSCIVMAPTHELALQIASVFETIGKYTTVKTLCIHGGVDQVPQIEKLEEGVDIVVATPGRLFDLASQGYLTLSKTEILILDEADHMLDLGFIDDIRDLIKRIPKRRQTLFFSATINEHIKKLAYSLVNNAIRIQISPKDPVSKNITHAVAFVEMDDKRFFLERLIRENPESKILVFVRTKIRAERVAKAMEKVSIKTETIHGDKDQGDRSKVMMNFREGLNKVLITTDLNARGIDIPNVDFVVNYDLPEQSESYVHRVGRTGRGVQKGNAISFCSTEEKEILSEIETFLHNPIQVLEIHKQDYSETLKIANEHEHNWKALLSEEEEKPKKFKKKKK